MVDHHRLVMMQAMSVTPTLTPLGTTPADVDAFDLSKGAYKEHRELLQSVLRGGSASGGAAQWR